MKTNEIHIMHTDYQYPTKEERRLANLAYPNIEKFGFEDKHEFQLFIEDKKKITEVKRVVDLYHWDMCLLNKLGMLCDSYIFLFTSYQRGITNGFKGKGIINRFFFEYYMEIFYYFFFSTRDIITQILNVYCDFKLTESKVSILKISSKIKNTEFEVIFDKFLIATTDASEFRNNFTHKFPLNHPDYRGTIINDNGMESYGFGAGGATSYDTYMENINFSNKALAEFVDSLRIKFK
ncbi:MAG: Cthe_2314 family HEPN domain-containing protein [Paludibacter sp.]|nr:Cthe_2314 family HEPN domain-containing protein [Paludibacter sp.]